MAIVHQLGELFLGAVPTVLLILIFYFLMKSLFFKPLLAVMAERDARSIGAQKAAEAAQAAAAKQRVAGELQAARRDVETSIPQLASEIASRILQSPASPSREVR